MKIDIIDNEIDRISVLRIFDLRRNDILMLSSVFSEMASSDDAKNTETIDIQNEFEGVRRLRLGIEEGRTLSCNEREIVWSMPRSDWHEAQLRTDEFDPISKERNRFQWLTEDALEQGGDSFFVLLSESEDGLW